MKKESLKQTEFSASNAIDGCMAHAHFIPAMGSVVWLWANGNPNQGLKTKAKNKTTII